MNELIRFECKCCGAPLDVREARDGVLQCPYCATLWTLPRPEATPAALSFLRMGEHDLDTCRFDDALSAYKKAAELDPEEPEAYFGMALAAFKVQYLKDEVNQCLHPICHEISEKVFTEDKNYKKALEFATVEQKKVYRRRGTEIDDIRDEFSALQKSGADYDCFLCVKVTEEDGSHTEDYNRANEIYYYLKDEGYKPFFSERELKGRTGSAYEALILYALYTSECMLIVCSDEDYLQTKWMKNEYTRFTAMIANEEKARDALTFVFAGKPIERLPNGKRIQGIDLLRPDAYSRIAEYVESHTPDAVRKRLLEEEERRRAFEEQRRQLEEQQKLLEEQRKELERLRRQNGKEQAGERSGTEYSSTLHKTQEDKNMTETKLVCPYCNTINAAGVECCRACGASSATFLPYERFRGERAIAEEFQIENGVLKKYIGKGGSVVIPDCVTSIGECAFRDCKNVVKVTIPDSVTSIGKGAFRDCTNLTKVTIPDSVSLIDDWTFCSCSSLKEITIPKSVVSIGSRAFYCCLEITSLVIPHGVTTLGAYSFYGCGALKTLVIPNSVTSIGSDAFLFCNNLKRITMPKVLLEGRRFSLFGNYESMHIKFTFTK